MTNPYGDIELTPKGMRALAHPVRLAILSQLQRHGASTATTLAPIVGASPSVTSWHLRHLAEHGLVRDADVGEDRRQRWWEATASGFRMVAPTDEADQEAYRQLTNTMFADAERLPRIWSLDVEPRLEPEWRALAGLANTRIVATAVELASIEQAMEALLAPYVLRRGVADPAGSRSVRILRYALPELT
jgi:DNA-binding transcriptional ArsR family regulator